MTRVSVARLAALASLWVLTQPNLALACAVCGGNTPEESKLAFIVTTALLTFLPLIMFGSIVLWLRKRFREVEGQTLRPDELGR